MGYTTDFHGAIDIEPPLDLFEVTRLREFCDSTDHNVGPGGYCQWLPTDDGAQLEWDGGEKFYDSAPWMKYVVDTFIKPNHVANGTIEAQGEDSDDAWALIVEDNVVFTEELERTPRFGTRTEV